MSMYKSKSFRCWKSFAFPLMIMLLLALGTICFAESESVGSTETREEDTDEAGDTKALAGLNTTISSDPGYTNYTTTHSLTVGSFIRGHIDTTYTGSMPVPDFAVRLFGTAYNKYGAACGSYDAYSQISGSAIFNFTTPSGPITGTAYSASGSVSAWINNAAQPTSTLLLP